MPEKAAHAPPGRLRPRPLGSVEETITYGHEPETDEEAVARIPEPVRRRRRPGGRGDARPGRGGFREAGPADPLRDLLRVPRPREAEGQAAPGQPRGRHEGQQGGPG